MSCKYFGTDGIRGGYGQEPLTPAFVRRLGYALGRYLERLYPDTPRHVVIGRDTRASGPEIEKEISEGLCLRGAHMYHVGIVPTPAIAMCARELNAQLGIAITASHNPHTDNGIKLFGPDGIKLGQEQEEAIECLIEQARPPENRRFATCGFEYDAESLYINFMRSLLHLDCLSGWRILVDTANGASCRTTPAVLRHFGAEVLQIGNTPDGTNINRDVGSEHPRLLSEAVLRHQAHFGLAHDGDADRLVLCDETGTIVDGDKVLGLLALYAHGRRQLRHATLVATHQSNTGLDVALLARGITVKRVPIGDRHVVHEMLASGVNWGGEQSGHIVCTDCANTGDGLLAAIKVIEAMLHTGRPLSSLAADIPLFPQVQASLRIREKKPMDKLRSLKTTIRSLEKKLAGQGQVLVRYSGTEAKIRLLIEGEDPDFIKKGLEKLKLAVSKDLELL